ncbi:MAG: hypothetical protein QOJ09_989, partial [Actinomycetota bacterium]|nr:hypothetical protein [Actinomycetota bacterium]
MKHGRFQVAERLRTRVARFPGAPLAGLTILLPLQLVGLALARTRLYLTPDAGVYLQD